MALLKSVPEPLIVHEYMIIFFDALQEITFSAELSPLNFLR
jgi:hypothetical protein